MVVLALIGLVLLANHVAPRPVPLPAYTPSMLAQALGQAGASANTAKLAVTPESALFDEPVTVQVSGLRPGQLIGLSATATDAAGELFESAALFQADEQGLVDSSRQAPIEGSYQSIASSGLLWSMSSDSGRAYLHSMDAASQPMEIRLHLGSGNSLSQEIWREYPWGLTRRTPVQLEGVLGELWQPAEPGQFPLVVMLGGYEGGQQSVLAASFAARGFAVLDLVYFGQPPLPEVVQGIALEHPLAAIDWAMAQTGVNGQRIGLFGRSKGAELALLLASNFERFEAVAAWSPTYVSWAGTDPDWPVPKASWTFRGKDITYLPIPPGTSTLWRGFSLKLGHPVALRQARLQALNNKTYLGLALVDAVQIAGSLLLVSGDDDQVWPSALMNDMLALSLRKSCFPYAVEQLQLQGAGHRLDWEQWPVAAPVTDHLVLGGTRDANHLAGQQAWQKTLLYFHDTLYSPRAKAPPAWAETKKKTARKRHAECKA